MKKEVGKDGRILYKFSHSVAEGGNVYIHKTLSGEIIKNKPELRNALDVLSKKYNLIDPTIKIYDTIFFLFFHMPKSLAPAEVIDSIQKTIGLFGKWHEDYLFSGVYNLQEQFVRKDIEKWGFDFDKG